MRNHVLRATFQGDDVAELFRRIVASRREFSPMPEEVFANLAEDVPVSSSWLEDGLAKFRRSLSAGWPGPIDPSWPRISAVKDGSTGGVQVHLRVDWTVACVVEYARSIGSWLSVFGHLFYGHEGWKVRRSIDSPHLDLGWGCLFAGEKAYQRLVSRRWLEHGPWWLRRFPGDVSLVQFHDLDADAETALAQGLPGHRRMSDHETGGWLRSSYRPVSSYRKDVPEFRALYGPADQSLRVVCAPGREVSQGEMLDACAERLVARYNADKPVRSVRYVFLEPADAEKHLHEMWLRELEVWAIVDGAEVRLDAAYQPQPTPPEWVLRVQERNDQ